MGYPDLRRSGFETWAIPCGHTYQSTYVYTWEELYHELFGVLPFQTHMLPVPRRALEMKPIDVGRVAWPALDLKM